MPAAVVEDNTVLPTVSPRPFQPLASIDEVQKALDDPEAHQRDLEHLETQIYDLLKTTGIFDDLGSENATQPKRPINASGESPIFLSEIDG
jgi:hypothetical protein